MATARIGQFVLENTSGQVVRTFALQAEHVYLIYRGDTRRVEIVSSFRDLTEANIAVSVLGEFTRDELKKEAWSRRGIGSVKWVQQVRSLPPTQPVSQDNPEEFKKIIAWTGGVHLALIAILIMTSVIVSKLKDEPATVTIVPQSELELTPQPIPKQEKVTVAPSDKKLKKVTERVTRPKKIVKNVSRRTTTAKRKAPTKNTILSKNTAQKPREGKRVKNRARDLGEMGALGALGGKNSSAGRRQGLDVGAVQKGGVGGMGANVGRAGIDRAVFSGGLVAASSGGGVGSGSGAGGGGGYNTRGMGSGHSGYGKHSLAGSSTGFVRPVESGAVIDGGLERSEIEAVVRKNKGQIVYCYEKGLQVRPRIQGRVNVFWIINAKGRVQLTQVKHSSLDDAKVESCIASKVRGWAFPKPRGGVDVRVTFPFVLDRTNQS